MERRKALQLLSLSGLALTPLPSWAVNWSSRTLATKKSIFDSKQETLITELVNMILPAHEGVGGISTGTDKFLIALISNCYEADIQEQFKSKLNSLSAGDTSNKALLEKFQNMGKSEDPTDKRFFNLFKSETIRGFTTCELVMTKYLKYEVAPGHYHGCVDA